MLLNRWLESLRKTSLQCLLAGAAKRRLNPHRRKTAHRLGDLPTAVESLEDRALLATINWVGGPSGNWNLAANWSTASLPTVNDDVTINTSSVVSILPGDGISIHSLTTGNGDTLVMTGGNLSINGDSTLAGTLTMSGGTLEASGAGVTVVETGATSVNQASLTAANGATLSLPNLTSYVASGTFKAQDAGSVLDVSNLATVTPGFWTIFAIGGATLDLSSLTSLQGGIIGITDFGNSRILDGNLTTLDGVSVDLDGTDPHAADSWTSFTHGSLHVSGGTYNLPQLSNVDNSTLLVQSGGILSLPNVTTYASNGVFQSTGAGSQLNFPNLATVTQSHWAVQSLNGGTIDISSLTNLDGGGGMGIQQSGNGRILDGSLTSLNSVSFEIDGTDSHVADAWTSFTRGTVTVSGGSFNLPQLTNVDNSNILVRSGGHLTLPNVIGAVTGGNFQADGAGSLLNVAHLTSADITVGNGAVAVLPLLATGTVTVGAGGQAQLQGDLLSLPADGTSGGVVDVPQIAGINYVLKNTGTLTGTTFNVGQNTHVALTGGTYLGGATFHVGQGSTINLTGGQATSYGGVLTGSGSGTVLFSGGNLTPALGGLTLNFAGGLFQWTGGAFYAHSGDVTNLGTLNLTGTDSKGVFEDATLFNLGTIIQTGTGSLSLHSDNLAPTTFFNKPGGVFLIASDSGIDNSFGGQVAVQNEGVIRKTAGTGVSDLIINGNLTNTGTIEADSGTLYLHANSISQVSGNTLTAGTWNALNGSTLKFPSGTDITVNQASITLEGAGAAIAAGNAGSAVNALANLTSNSGSLNVGSGATLATTGDFSNSGSLSVGGNLAITGAFTQTATGVLNSQLGGNTPGTYGHLAVTGNVTLDGALHAATTGSFSTNLGDSFTVLDFGGTKSGTFSSSSLPNGVIETFTDHALTLSIPFTSSDLHATTLSGSGTAAVGSSFTTSWTVENRSSIDAAGNWQDSIYLSTTPTITARSILLGATPHLGGLTAGDSYTSNLTTNLPALPPGNYFVLVQVDSLYQTPDNARANNILAASGLLNLTVPMLTLGAPEQDAFTAANQDHYYQVTVPVGGALTIALQSNAPSGATALYVSQGAPPTPYSYQYAAVSNQPNQTLQVPQVLSAGTYYILAHSVSGAAATAGYSLTVNQTSGLGITSISNYAGGNSGQVTIEIDGTNFTPDATASLTLNGTVFHAVSVEYISASQIFATFDLNGAIAGGYTVGVQAGANSATSPTPFQVIQANPGSLDIALGLPQFVRSGRTGTITVTYTNSTSNDLVAPILLITSSNPTVFFSTPDNPNSYQQSTQVLGVAPNGPAGILRPGQTGQLTLTLLSNDTVDHNALPVTVDQTLAGQSIDWAAQKALLKPASFPAAAWDVVFQNLLSILGTTTDSYNAALAHAATYLGDLGGTIAQTSDIANLWSFLVAQANDSFPVATLTSTVDASLPVPGSLSLSLDRTFVSTPAGRSSTGLFGLGYTCSWQSALSTDPASGNVSLTAGGAQAFFVKQANGTYLDTAGAFGTLTRSGTYTFTDTHGTQYVFLANGKLNYEQDTNGNRITLGYNASNQLVTLTYSNVNDASEPTEQISLEYNAQGFVSQTDDGQGDVWQYQYDGSGHLVTVTAPGNLVTSYAYDTSANAAQTNALLSITTPDGFKQSFTYDSQGRLATRSANGGLNLITYTYVDEAEVRATDTAGNVTTTWFNQFAQPVRVEDPRGATSTMRYDNNGQLIGTTNAIGDSYSYFYDTRGNLAQTINPLGQSVTMVYSPLSQLTQITDEGGHSTQYTRDSAGNLLSITYPGGSSQSFTYDPLGNMSDTILQNGHAIGYEHNAEGLTTSQTFADDTSRTFTYDAHGNLLTANDFDSAGTPTGTTTLTYNAAHQLTHVTYPDGRSLQFVYNAATGQRTQSVDQDGFTVNYLYDAPGRLSGLTDGGNSPIVTYTYNSLGQLTKKQNGNGTNTTYAYDAAGNLLHEVNFADAAGATVNSSLTFTYNLLGKITSTTDSTGHTTGYGYDAIGQLTQVILPGGRTINYAYDAAGNRTAVVDNGTTTLYGSNSDNEITQVDTATYTYDANGNLSSVTDDGETTSYVFNDLNQLVSVTSTTGSVTTFQYSALGGLIGQNVDGVQTNFLVDPSGLGNTVASYNGDGTLIAHYLYGLGLVSQTGPTGTGYYDFDSNSNTIGITGSLGTYVNQYQYLPFGETTSNSAALPNPFTFAGGSGVMQIGPDLFNMRARDYSPTTGQFLSNDPLGLAGGDTNIRRYVGNDSVNNIDPSGLFISPTSSIDPLTLWLWRSITPGWDDALTYPTYYGFGIGTGGSSTVGGAGSGAGDTSRGPTGSETPEGYFIGRTTTPGYFDELIAGDRDFWGPNGFDWWSFYGGLYGGGFATAGGGGKTAGLDGGGGGDSEITEVIKATDPNSLIGPAGFGAAGYLQPVGTWSYTVTFENEGSVAAQDVSITQQLDSNLDWSSFQWGSFGFGAINIAIPPELTQYQTTVNYQNTDESALNVLVSFDFNVQTGLLTVSFTSLDPLTGLAPNGVFDGFLPPNDATHIGEGLVQYTVRPKSGLATGTTVAPQPAAIVFDINDPIDTNSVVNTIDAGAPSSFVTSLPAITSSDTINLNWSGTDDAGGSGIATYDIYVSDNSGPWQLFVDGTTNTSAVYTGVIGHTYSFYSVATDNVGHQEAAPEVADTQTTLAVNHAPSLLDQVFSLAENSPQSTVAGQLAATDEDVADTLTYSVTGGNAQGAFALNPQTGEITVANASLLDFETTPVWTLFVQVADNHGATGTATVTIDLTDINDAPTLSQTGGTVTFSKKAAKQSGPVSVVPTLQVQDPDQSPANQIGGGTLTISVDAAAKVSKKGKFTLYDTFTGLTGASSLGTTTGPTFANGKLTLTVHLNAGTTTTAVQNFLQGIKFSTKGAGLKQSHRSFAIQVTDAAGAASNLLQQSITVTK